MAIGKSNKLYTFLKLFILDMVGFYAINVVVLILKNYCNLTLFKNYELYSFATLIPASAFIALLNIPRFSCITKAIRTDNRLTDQQKLIEAMYKMKWEIRSEDANEMVFKSKSLWRIFEENIVVMFTGMELHVFGPKEFVEKFIFLANFQYEAYVIRNSKVC